MATAACAGQEGHFPLRNSPMTTNRLMALPLVRAALATGLTGQTTYYPAAGAWQHKAPAEVGMDATKLQKAVEFAKAHGSKWGGDS